jgi:hypothetical protein
MRIVALLAPLIALAACVPHAPKSAASKPSRAAQMAQVHFYDQRVPADKPGEFTVRFDDGSGERTVRPSDFQLREWGFPTSERLATRSAGTLEIKVTLSRRGRPVSEGSVSLPLKPDWIYGISLSAHARNPVEGCLGCMGVRSFPIEGEPAEKLHIVWGGNSISAPLPS